MRPEIEPLLRQDSRESCPACGHVDDRDAFEGWEGYPPHTTFLVRCPKCEAVHPDQTNTPIEVDDAA